MRSRYDDVNMAILRDVLVEGRSPIKLILMSATPDLNKFHTYFKEKGAFSVDPDSGLFTVNFAELEAAISDLTRDIVILQAGGDYDAAAAFLEGYALLDEAALAALARAGDIPVDIQPTYPDEI